jgi:alkylation response protein AidB-like acyl-CoA dehydrogenase
MKETEALSSMAKCYATDMAMRVTTDAVQILGGYGYMKDYPVERMMRDAKVTQIYEGANQYQLLDIAQRLLKG